MKNQGFSSKFTETYIDENTGEKFHKIKKSSQVQMFLSLLAKGVINTADIIEKDGEYFSHEQNADSVASMGDEYLDEMKADLIILEHVFRDVDHDYYATGDDTRNSKNMKTGILPGNSFREHSNILVDENTKKINYFDFNFADLVSGLEKQKNELTSGIFLSKFSYIKNTKVLETLKAKSHYFLDYIFKTFNPEDKDNAFTAIVTKSKINFGERSKENQKEFFELMRQKFQIIYDFADSKLREINSDSHA